ncbi:MAG: NAD(P)-dependent oxidoreductase [Dehalococcoidia bacterium]|nr:NAD(P)-dependent oxidoreductase [Dehalococcoidia bacterium]
MSVERRIVIPGDYPPQLQGSPHLERLADYGNIELYEDLPADEDELVRRAEGAPIVINSHGALKWPASVLERLPELELISLCSVGTDCVELEAARRLGIRVCNQGGHTAPIVAEHEFALMLAVAKHLAQFTAELKSGNWQGRELVTLRGKTIGIVGTGNSGRYMADLCRGIGMNVIAWSFNPRRAWASGRNVTYMELDELFARADVVSLHVGLSERTRHLAGREQFQRMKPGAMFINGSRGAVVDTEALVEALREGRLRGAGLDVSRAGTAAGQTTHCSRSRRWC